MILFEILSESIGATDRVFKAREYRATPSVMRYILLEQTEIGVTVFRRGPDGSWHSDLLIDGDDLALPEVGLDPIPLAERYTELVFSLAADG